MTVSKKPGPFKQCAEQLIRNGYSPVPTRFGYSKGPREPKNWEKRCRQASHLSLSGQVTDGNIAVACGYRGLVAIDIDTDDKWAHELVTSIFGRSSCQAFWRKRASGLLPNLGTH